MDVMPKNSGRSTFVVVVSVAAAFVATTMYLVQSVHSFQAESKGTMPKGKQFSEEGNLIVPDVTAQTAPVSEGYEPVPGTALAPDGDSAARMQPYQPEKQKAFQQAYEFTTESFLPSVAVWTQALAPYKDQPNVQYLEVGTNQGMSLCWLLENILTGADAHATAIESFQASEDMPNAKERYFQNIEKTGKKDQVETIEGLSYSELRKLADSHYDIIYLDGSHQAPEVLEEAILSLRLLKPGGLLIFDDYASEQAGAENDRSDAAINAFYQFHRDQLEVVHKGYQVILRKLAKS